MQTFIDYKMEILKMLQANLSPMPLPNLIRTLAE
jgi:hypothetical protein